MKLTFLSAAVPLTKTISYNEREDAYTVAPYPMISRVTSHHEGASNLIEFRDKIIEQGKLGRCLLFGDLDQPLVDESRAGHAVKTMHEWVCLDFDKVQCPPTIKGAQEAITKYLPDYCHEAECVIQLSPSCFHPKAEKLSAHVFMRLSMPQDSDRLKAWLIWCNFRSPLREELCLTDSGHTLSFALDRCVTDASRLLYIAPPKTVGFTSKLDADNSIEHYPGTALVIPDFVPVTREQMNERVNVLREEAGLDKRDFKIVVVKGMDVLLEPGESMIHDVRSSGDGYIRFNLNGGNSLAYWLNLKDPSIIGNFKGEPFMYTRQANEKFYKGLVQSLQQAPVNTRNSPSTDVLAFYATNRGSKLYVGTYDRVSDTLRLDTSTNEAAASWLRQFGVPMKQFLPHYDLDYDVGSNLRYEEGYPVINLYARTDFIKKYADAERLIDLDLARNHMAGICPVIYKIMASITGDARSHIALLNWLGYIFQTRQKSGTAWLLHGVPGTGKGLFLEKVIKPLLGHANVSQIMMSHVDDNFNSVLEGKLLVNVDESAMTRTRDKVESMSKIKNWITEPHMMINEKHQVQRSIPSFVNFIFTSNDMRPLALEEGDRRFHVGTRQEVKLIIYPNEIAILEQGEELPAFAEMLGKLQVNETLVRNPETSSQKSRLFESTHSLLDSVGIAIKDGDAGFFLDARPSAAVLQSSISSALLPIKAYDELVRGMLDGTTNVLGPDDLYVLFQVVVHDVRYFPDNPSLQKKIYARYNLAGASKTTIRCKRRKKSVLGVKAPIWQPVDDALLEEFNEKAPPPLDGVEDTLAKRRATKKAGSK